MPHEGLHRSVWRVPFASSLLLHLGVALLALTLGLSGTALQEPPLDLVIDLSRLELTSEGGGSGTNPHLNLGRPAAPAAPAAARPAAATTPAPALSPQAATEEVARQEIAAPVGPPALPQGQGQGQAASGGAAAGTGPLTALGTGTSAGGGTGPAASGGWGDGLGPGLGHGLSGVPRDYLLALHAAIERHKSYPTQARRRGLEGKVRVGFVVERDGRISRVEVVGSSGSSLLDEAAASTLRRIGQLPPLPTSLKLSSLKLELPLIYRLTR